MLRRSLMVAAALLAAQTGCRSRCSDPHPGLFTSNTKGGAPCQLAGRDSGCFDAMTGQPVPCPPQTGMPGGTYPQTGPVVPGGPRPDDLHMPSPNDMIRPPAIPYPAPGDAILPPPTSPGTPVKGGPYN